MNISTALNNNLLSGLGGNPLEKFNAEAMTPGKTVSFAELEKVAPKLNPALSTPSAGGAASFSQMLGDFVGEVNAKSQAAGEAVGGLLAGQKVPLHQAVIAMEEAGVSFQLMVEVRNKLMEAYQELMRMQM